MADEQVRKERGALHEPGPRSGDESPHSGRFATPDAPWSNAKLLECVRFAGALGPWSRRMVDSPTELSPEPPPERGLQSAGSHAGQGTSLRAEARAPHEFMTTEPVQTEQAAARAPARILVRGVNWLGDAVMSTPALLRLRERFPSTRIALLTPEKLADLWRHHPAVDDVYILHSGEQPWQIARRLREERFNVGIAFPNSPRSALELWLARIPIRVGYRRPWRNWFLTHAVRPGAAEIRMRKRPDAEVRQLWLKLRPETRPSVRVFAEPTAPAHQIHLYLDLAGAVGASTTPAPPTLQLSASEHAAATEVIRRLAGASRPLKNTLVAMNAGAEYGPAKRWPRDRFVEAGRQIASRVDCQWIVVGGLNDTEGAREICAQVPGALCLAGRTNLRELMQVLAACRLLLTNDSGPAHVAAALGTPVTAIFGSTAPGLTAPGLPGDPRHRIFQSTVPCSPCFRRECPIGLPCLNEIPVEPVVASILNQLSAAPA